MIGMSKGVAVVQLLSFDVMVMNLRLFDAVVLPPIVIVKWLAHTILLPRCLRPGSLT